MQLDLLLYLNEDSQQRDTNLLNGYKEQLNLDLTATDSLSDAVYGNSPHYVCTAM